MSLVSKINALAQGIAADIKALAAGTGIALLAGGGLAPTPAACNWILRWRCAR
jgi:hypothetical protein